ncbi:unnamed protein product [Ranitomeya imitator]|uniref:CCHC-type domain-containing protein n=1 Tax=Ranitomeya imitator TaxID=111125 RepID=A0ABN9MK74_9NEOB|nr:unnamed protein product [Ranitomeya imitator]
MTPNGSYRYYETCSSSSVKCGKAGHLASACTVVKCSLCGKVSHVAADCQNIRRNLCVKIGHPHKDCPDAWHNICRDFPDEDLVVDAEAQEEEPLMSGEILTRSEIHQESRPCNLSPPKSKPIPKNISYSRQLF